MNNMVPVEMPQPLGIFAAELLDRSEQYFGAFKELTSRSGEKHLHAAYFLFAHALEISLKAYLAARGVRKSRIRSMRHDLPRLLAECRNNGIPDTAHIEEFVLTIHEMNKDQDFRYPSGYKLTLPSPKDCISLLDELHGAVKPIVAVEHAKAALQFASGTRHLRGRKIRWSD